MKRAWLSVYLTPDLSLSRSLVLTFYSQVASQRDFINCPPVWLAAPAPISHCLSISAVHPLTVLANLLPRLILETQCWQCFPHIEKTWNTHFQTSSGGSLFSWFFLFSFIVTFLSWCSSYFFLHSKTFQRCRIKMEESKRWCIYNFVSIIFRSSKFCTPPLMYMWKINMVPWIVISAIQRFTKTLVCHERSSCVPCKINLTSQQ